MKSYCVKKCCALGDNSWLWHMLREGGLVSGRAKPSLLITNLFLLSRTGSELHVCELSKAFIDRGWDVTAYSLVVGYPTQGVLESLGVNIVQYGEEGKLLDSYDLLFAQHHLVADYLWSNTNVRFKKIVISILGLGGDEALPSFYQEASAAIFVSEESRDHYSKAFCACRVPRVVFPNSVSRDYFGGMSKRGLMHANIPTKIGVISNHVPEEVLKLRDILPDGMSIDFLGYEKESIEITPQIVRSFDVIISIGRTVQACFAAGVPCYCYDRFGGPGFIDVGELDLHAYANFSGRSQPSRLSSHEILNDILNRYSHAVSNLARLNEEACDRWCFEKQFDQLYDLIMGLPAYVDSGRRDSIDALTINNAETLCDLYREVILSSTGTAQFFWFHADGGISEENSFKVRYQYRSWIDVSSIRGIPDDCVIARFDPDEHPCATKVKVNKNGEVDVFKHSFYDYDPQIVSGIMGESDFAFCVQRISDLESNRELHKAIRASNENAEELFETITEMEYKCSSIKWLIGKIMRELGKRISRHWKR